MLEYDHSMQGSIPWPYDPLGNGPVSKKLIKTATPSDLKSTSEKAHKAYAFGSLGVPELKCGVHVSNC